MIFRTNICFEKNCDTVGLAHPGSMCRTGCAIIKDIGLATAFHIAHELGHM